MKVEKKKIENALNIRVEGRLDTSTAPQLESEISDLDGIEKIVFDFEKLEYISSSGLRLVLKCKKMVDDTVIINCTSEVFDVFNITGFSEMMEIKKALKEVSIDNCEKIGEGFYGNIYRIDPETIVKVYKVPDPLDMIKRERLMAKKAFVMGIPTAIAYDTVKVGDSYGAVFELLNAKMPIDCIKDDKDLDEFSKKCAETLKSIHKKIIEDDDFPSRKQTLLDRTEECKDVLDKETYEKIVYLLNTIPETKNLLHCDFHIKNIMIQDDELLIIDMDKLSVGHPIFEFGAIYATYIGFSCVDKENTTKFLGLSLEKSEEMFNKILRYYYDDKNEEELQDIITKLSIISYIQILWTRYTFGNDLNDTAKEEIEFCKNYLKDTSEKLETLQY